MKIPFLRREVMSNDTPHVHVFDSDIGCEPCTHSVTTKTSVYGTALFCKCGAWRFYKGEYRAQRSA